MQTKIFAIFQSNQGQYKLLKIGLNPYVFPERKGNIYYKDLDSEKDYVSTEFSDWNLYSGTKRTKYGFYDPTRNYYIPEDKVHKMYNDIEFKQSTQDAESWLKTLKTVYTNEQYENGIWLSRKLEIENNG